ncbi:MAG TPA: pyridoxal phosphate-dependent aminotransferase [Pseudomonadales bacterium]|nr:pyridoxal phosphate-dependent aminotransferase [Pseudomonadales bacterium]HNF09739.1 pyridoxal phosphate-dependent aminotransferase [Pseudomonadales bacterium]
MTLPMIRPLPSKLPQVGTTIFTRMSALAAECGAINLSQGFPDFDGPALLRERLHHYVEQGYNQYAPMTGVATLREAIAEQVARRYRRRVDAEQEVTVTSGATEALYAAITAVVRPGDEVILFDPAYDSYEPAIELSGGTARHIALEAPEFRIDWNRVADCISDRTRLIIINSPHNPTGSVLAGEDLQQLAALVRQRDIWLIADEVYEYIHFDGLDHASFHRHAELAARSFIISSFGKSFHITGWKLGYCIAPPPLSAEFRKVHQFLTFASFTPAQWAIADTLRAQPEHLAGLPAFYQQKRDLFAAALKPSRFELLPCRGTYFQLAAYDAIVDLNDVEFAQWLTREAKVAVIPVSVFYQTPPATRIVRFCFAKSDAVLLQAAERLCRL